MVEVREATALEAQSWLDSWTQRLQEWFAAFSAQPQWVRHHVESQHSRWADAQESQVFTLTERGASVGQLALRLSTEPVSVLLTDLWVQPQERRRGHGAAALEWAVRWARPRAGQLTAVTMGGDPAHAALFGHLEIRAIQMMKPLSPNDPAPVKGRGRPMRQEEFGPWRAAQESDYIDEVVASGLASREEASQIAARQFEELLPEGLQTKGQTFLCVEDSGGEVVAVNWISHGYQPGTSFVLGIEVRARSRGQGYGKAAMQLGEQASLAAGDTQLALNVFGGNDAAIGLYRGLGYASVQEIRSLKFDS